MELGRGVVGPARPLVPLVGLIGSRRRDEGDPALRERLLQGLERYVGEMGPVIRLGVAERRVILAGALHVGNREVHRHYRPPGRRIRREYRPGPSTRTSQSTPKARVRCASVRTSATGPAAAVFPPESSSTWVTKGGISSRWWVTSAIVGPSRIPHRRETSSRNRSRATGSSPSHGSSSTSSRGAGTSARAMSTRWRSPCERTPKGRLSR